VAAGDATPFARTEVKARTTRRGWSWGVGTLAEKAKALRMQMSLSLSLPALLLC